MTVKELYNTLGKYIEMGYADTRIIASYDCDFTICGFEDTYYDNLYLFNLKDVSFQKGDIELAFSDEEEK